MTGNSNQISQSDAKRFLTFLLDKEEYAIPLPTVKEVVAFPEITRVSHTPSHMLGLMNFRGQIFSVFDLRVKFGLNAKYDSEISVIICVFEKLFFGVVVDSVNSVLSFLDADIDSAANVDLGQSTEYVVGVGKNQGPLIFVLDIVKALNLEETLKKFVNENVSA